MCLSTAFAIVTALCFVSSSLSSTIKITDIDSFSDISLPVAVPVSLELVKRATPKRPKYKKSPRPNPPRSHHHPTGCTNTNLVKNGNFNKNVKGWQFLPGSSSQFFWAKDSKQRPAHSGGGQAYIFLNRGYAEGFLSTNVPAVEYGNTITMSAWLRYEEPNDLRSCTFQFTDNANAALYMDLTPKWAKYSFETAGTGRPIEIQFRLNCFGAPLPITIYLDDVDVNACIPKKANPECQAIAGADNRLVNPGFECPDGINAWSPSSYYGYGNDSIAQFSGTKANPTHSGRGMAGLLFDGSVLPYPPSGVALLQYNVDDDLTRQTMKASLWLSVDVKLNNVTGCMLAAYTIAGLYVQDIDLSSLTTKWSKFEFKDIRTTNLDTFQIGVYGCSNRPQPLIYVDDVYFGVDRASPTVTPTTTPPPEPTQTAGPCTSTPMVVDPSFELGDTGNWLFNDNSPNYDTSFLIDSTFTYGAPHSGSSVGVLYFQSPNADQTLMQQVFGLCNNQVYTVTAWFYVPVGYDASLCTFSVGIFASSGPVAPPGSGVWTKVTAFFLASVDSTSIFPYIYVSVRCSNPGEMVILIDDISFGPPPPCSIIPTISDGSFESGDLAIWAPGLAEGDEIIAISNKVVRTGTKSLILTFPSTSNAASFARNFAVCVGTKLTLHVWHYAPGLSKGSLCTVYAYAYFTGEVARGEITVYDSWVETKLDFLAGASTGTVVFGVSCLNQLKKVVVYLDDVSITTR